jgi:prepilin-type N-terminal cleavage/methylation domain-containing protein
MKKYTTYHLPLTTYDCSAFTLIELLVAVAIFTVVIIAFLTMLIAVTKVQVGQSSSAEVNQQSQFALQEIQYYVAHASVIDMSADTATTTLRLRMSASSLDPTIISFATGTLYLQQGSGALQALTSNKVTLSNLSFIKHSNPPGHDSVDVSFTIAYNTSNIEQALSEMFQTSVARVSAASFDSNLVPSSTAIYSLGTSGATWTSVNGILNFNGSNAYFSGVNVGIGVSLPAQALEVNGGVRINPGSAGVPAGCSSALRGTLWMTESGSGTKDTLQVCVKNASDTYLWATIY